jgi:hypothetical protein
MLRLPVKKSNIGFLKVPPVPQFRSPVEVQDSEVLSSSMSSAVHSDAAQSVKLGTCPVHSLTRVVDMLGNAFSGGG